VTSVELFRLSWGAVAAHRLRSVLTMIGIVLLQVVAQVRPQAPSVL